MAEELSAEELPDPEVVGTYRGVPVKFRDVWQDNLEQEMETIRNILDDYPYVGMVSASHGTLISAAARSARLSGAGAAAPPRAPRS